MCVRPSEPAPEESRRVIGAASVSTPAGQTARSCDRDNCQAGQDPHPLPRFYGTDDRSPSRTKASAGRHHANVRPNSPATTVFLAIPGSVVGSAEAATPHRARCSRVGWLKNPSNRHEKVCDLRAMPSFCSSRRASAGWTFSTISYRGDRWSPLVARRQKEKKFKIPLEFPSRA